MKTSLRALRPYRHLLAIIALVGLAGAIAYAWGSTGHKIINRTAGRHLPAEMAAFKADSAFFEAHASDADARLMARQQALFRPPTTPGSAGLSYIGASLTF